MITCRKYFFKKVRGTRKEGSLTSVCLQNKYRAIQDLHATENLPTILLYEIAGVSRVDYYNWLQRMQQVENEAILQDIQAIYARVGGIYGYRRMINRIYHKRFHHKRIYRLMHITGLQSVIRRKRKRYVPLVCSICSWKSTKSRIYCNQPQWKMGNRYHGVQIRKRYVSVILAPLLVTYWEVQTIINWYL